MKTNLTFLFAVAALALRLAGATPTNDLTATLKKGLYEEEANRNLEAAIAAYQQVVARFDKDRRAAATAVYRLGECYRKLGRTNDAVAQFERVIREFADDETLVKVSRNNLAGLGRPATSNPPDGALAATESAAQAAVLAAQLAAIESSAEDKERLYRAVLATFPDEGFKRMLLQLPRLQEQERAMRADANLRPTSWAVAVGPEGISVPPADVPWDAARASQELEKQHRLLSERLNFILGLQKERLRVLQAVAGATSGGAKGVSATEEAARAEQKRLFEQEVKLAETELEMLKKQFEVGRAEQASLLAKERDILRLRRQMVGADLPTDPTGGAAAKPAGETQEEEAEIRRIQALVQNSPDLINAHGNTPETQGLAPLHLAARRGQRLVVQYLLDHGADVNRLSRGLDTPLHLAATAGHNAVVRLLLERKAAAEARDDVGRTALHLAASRGFKAVAESLLDYQADVNAATKAGWTPLHEAASAGFGEMVELLLAKGARIDAAAEDGSTPLHAAASSGRTAMVTDLVGRGTEVNARTRTGETPLLLAVARQDRDSVKTLLLRKADPNLPGRVPRPSPTQGFPRPMGFPGGGPGQLLPVLPLQQAVGLGEFTMVELLLASGAVVDGELAEEPRPLFRAIGLKDERLVSLLLKAKADPRKPDREGQPPLLHAMGVESPEIVQQLLEAGADPNAPTPNFDTAFLFAVRHGQTAITKLLLEHGASINACSSGDGNTALHWAVTGGYGEIVNLLLQHKADVNARNLRGETPLDLTKSGGSRPPAFSGLAAPMAIPQPGRPVPSGASGRRGPVTGAPAPTDLGALLRTHGAREDLPRFDRITIKRTAMGYSRAVFQQRTNDWARYTLLDLLAVQYGLLTPAKPSGQPGAGGPVRSAGSTLIAWSVQNAFGERNPLPYPDLARIVINRPSVDGAWSRIDVDAQAILEVEEGCRDVDLLWGDEVELPETDHPINEAWPGFSVPALRTFQRCLTRKVQVVAKGEAREVSLGPAIEFLTNGSVMSILSNQAVSLGQALNESKQVRASSDLSRIKIRRQRPAQGAPADWTVDCSSPDVANTLWLCDGDVIEVPDKP